MSAGPYVATLVAGDSATLGLEVVAKAMLAVEGQGGRSLTLSWLEKDKAADIAFTLAPPAASMLAALKGSLNDAPIDILLQPALGRRKKLLIADMESTVIEQEMLDELADAIGQRDKVAAITKRAMNGELDFVAALKERVSLLKGQPAALLDDMARRITYMPGAETLVAGMKARGAACWLVSGGFTCFAEPVARHLGFDAVHANRLVVENGVITGDVAAPILDRDAKRRLMEQACSELGLTKADTLAVGDGANDIPMLAACVEGDGLGVAYHAKPKVRAAVAPQINFGDLTALLYAQGLTSSSRT